MVSAKAVVDPAGPSGQLPVLNIPKQEVKLLERGLGIYFQELRELRVVHKAPSTDPDCLYVGFWEDHAVEQALGYKVSVVAVVQNYGNKGQKQAIQSAYYLMSAVRNAVLYNLDGSVKGGQAASREGLKGLNRVNAQEENPTITWGTGWPELRAPQEFANWQPGVTDWHSASLHTLQIGLGGIQHMQQRLLQLEVQLGQTEQAPLPTCPPLCLPQGSLVP